MGGNNFVGFMNNQQRIPLEQFEDIGNLSGLINDPMSAGINPGELGTNDEIQSNLSAKSVLIDH